MLTDKTLLAKCITLLYRENLLPSQGHSNEGLVRTSLEFIRAPELDMDTNHEGKMITGLKDLALKMCDQAGKYPIEQESLIQEIQLICAHDQTTAESLIRPIQSELTDTSLKRSVTDLARQLQNYFREEKSREILIKAGNRVKFHKDSIKSWKDFLSEHLAELEPYTVDSTTKDPAIIAEYQLNEISQVTQAFQKMDDISSGKAIIRFGQQGLNRMFNGGLVRGMTGALYAISHHGKSGNAMEFFADWCMYNTPYMTDTAKKPANVFITFENEAESNIDMFYRLIREGETQSKIEDLPETTKEERAQYLSEKLSCTGYTPFIIRVTEGAWGYRDICNYITKLESQGYEIHCLIVDYLALANRVGCIQGAQGTDLKDLWRKMRAFCSAKQILFLSPHQLNKEARRLAQDTDPAEIVKRLVGAGYTEGCNTLETEMDFDIYLWMVKRKGNYYNTFARGKHRVNNPAPQEDHYTCYRSYDAGRMRCDLFSPSQSLKRPGDQPADTGYSNAAADYFDNDPIRIENNQPKSKQEENLLEFEDI